MVGGDITIMLGPGSVIFPSELNANAQASVGNLLQIFCLTLTVIVVCGRYGMHSDLFIRVFYLADGFHQIHQVSQLVEQSDIGVGHDDPFGASQVRPKNIVKTHAALIFLKDEMLLFQNHCLGSLLNWSSDCWLTSRRRRQINGRVCGS